MQTPMLFNGLQKYVCGFLLLHVSVCQIEVPQDWEKLELSLLMLGVGNGFHNVRGAPQVERRRKAWKLAGGVKQSRTERISSRPSDAAGSHHETRLE